MIAFKYTKTDGAEYLSHLDLLRHMERTFRRAGIEVGKSEGFHPHPKIYMNNPLGLGVKSVAEYCAVETPFCGDFKEVFNANSPKGVKCLDYKIIDVNPNYANSIESCSYTVEGINFFDTKEFMNRGSIVITDKRGRTVDILPRIYKLEFNGATLSFTLGCGQNNLRPDLFTEVLEAEFGGKAEGLIKTASHGEYTF